MSSKSKAEENEGLLLSRTGALLTRDMEEAVLLNDFFASVFTGEACPQATQVLQTPTESVGMKQYPQEKRTRVESILSTGTHRSIGPHRLHPRVPREVSVSLRVLFITFEMLWQLRKIAAYWKNAVVILILKKDKEEYHDNHKWVNLNSTPGKRMKQILPKAI